MGENKSELALLPQNRAEAKDTKFRRQLSSREGKKIISDPNGKKSNDRNDEDPSNSQIQRIWNLWLNRVELATKRSRCHHGALQQGQARKTRKLLCLEHIENILTGEQNSNSP